MRSPAGRANESSQMETDRSVRETAPSQKASGLTQLNTGTCTWLVVHIRDKHVLRIIYSEIKHDLRVYLASAMAPTETLLPTKKPVSTLHVPRQHIALNISLSLHLYVTSSILCTLSRAYFILY